MSQSRFNRLTLLNELSQLCRQGQAENEPEDEPAFLRNFLPTRTHFRIFEPEVQLVIGDKGAGKTQLFRALSFERGRKALADLAAQQNRSALDVQRISWHIGYVSSGQAFPPGAVMSSFARTRNPVDLQTFWLALLVRALGVVQPRLLELPSVLDALIQSPSALIDNWFALASGNLGTLFAALDEMDRRLQHENRFVFVTYDDLDRVSPGDWQTLEMILQGLVQFWAAYGRRYRRLRPKLFLRRDLYERAALFGPDIAKIAAHRVELVWNVDEFYNVLLKRILNSSGNLPKFLAARMRLEQSPELGMIPVIQSEQDYRPSVEKLFGKFLGPDALRGFTYRWIPNHLKDGHRRIYPRPLLRLVEDAAELEKRDQKGIHMAHLIHHTALRGALDKVSDSRVQDLAQEEFPWLRQIQTAFRENPFVVPSERKGVLKSLHIGWPHGDYLPPSIEPNELLEYLVKLGIFQIRLDGRIDVGDLYLRGLHLKRKGGVARPKSTREER